MGSAMVNKFVHSVQKHSSVCLPLNKYLTPACPQSRFRWNLKKIINVLTKDRLAHQVCFDVVLSILIKLHYVRVNMCIRKFRTKWIRIRVT